MNLQLNESDVRIRCQQAGVIISAIEPLISGGTRLVCTTAAEADEMRRLLGEYLIDGAVSRHRFYRPPGSQGGY